MQGTFHLCCVFRFPIDSILQKGREWSMVLRLTKKAAIKEPENIISIFAVPHSEGRIYIEARAFEPVRNFLKGMVFVYTSSLFSVPVAERVELLSPGTSLPPIEIGEVVKVRNGMYEDDIGEVFDISDSHVDVTLKIKSRLPDPLPRGTKRKKGKRKGRDVRDPYVLDKGLLQYQHKEDERKTSFKDLHEQGFMFGRNQYTNDGYLLLTIRHDRLQRLPKGARDFKALTSTGARCAGEGPFIRNIEDNSLFVHPMSQIRVSETTWRDCPIPIPVNAGDSVRINDGGLAGAVGRVVELLSSTSALVDLRTPGISPRSTLVETDIRYLVRTFEIGDRIEVKHGELAGRNGVVFMCKGDTLSVVSLQELSEVCPVKLMLFFGHLPITYEHSSKFPLRLWTLTNRTLP